MADGMLGDIGKVVGDTVGPTVNGVAQGEAIGHIVEAMAEMNAQMGQLVGTQEAMHDLMQHTIDSLHIEAVPDEAIAPDAPMIDGHEVAHDTSYDVSADTGDHADDATG